MFPGLFGVPGGGLGVSRDLEDRGVHLFHGRGEPQGLVALHLGATRGLFDLRGDIPDGFVIGRDDALGGFGQAPIGGSWPRSLFFWASASALSRKA